MGSLFLAWLRSGMSFWWSWAALRGLGWLFLLFPLFHFYFGFVAQNRDFTPVLKLLHTLAVLFLFKVIPCVIQMENFWDFHLQSGVQVLLDVINVP